jgi:hypothetical protein
MIVHGRYVIHSIEQDPKKIKYLTKLILSVCDFLDSAVLVFEYDPKIQSEYEKFLKRISKKYDNFIVKANAGKSIWMGDKK